MFVLKSDEILKSLPTKYYVIDLKTKLVVQTNDPEIEGEGAVCFQQIFNKNEPCEYENGNCICQKQLLSTDKPEFVIKVGKGRNKRFFRANVSKLNDNLVLANYLEITENLLALKELKINTKRLERAQMLAEFGYWEFNIDEKIIFSSEGAREIYGVEKLEIPLEEVQKIALPEYRNEMNKRLAGLIAGEKDYNIKFEIKRPSDGEIRYIHSIAEYRKDKKMVFGVIHDITENTEAQQVVIENEKFLQLLFENMNSAFAYHKVITDGSGKVVNYKFIDVNPKFEEFTGLKRADILDKKVLDVLPKTEKSWINIYGKVALSGEPVVFTNYVQEIDKFFEVSAFSPRKGYFATSFTDVTARFKSEKILKDTLVDLKLAQRFAQIGSWKCDSGGKNIVWSEQVYKIFERDVSLGPVNIEDLTAYFKNTKHSDFHKAVSMARQKGKAFEMQLELQLKNNKNKWVEIICKPYKNSSKEGFNLRGTFQDITESKLSEEELSNSNKLLRTVIDNIPDAIYMKDMNSRKLIANKGDALNCGFKEVSEILGKSDRDLYPKEVAENYLKDDLTVLEEGKIIINREEILPAKGKNRWVLTSKFPLKNDNNKIVGLVGIGRDITAMKEQEAQLKLLQQTIEQSPLAVVITNPDGIIEFVNQGFVNITGYSMEDAIGNKPNILKSGLQNRDYYRKLWQTILSGENWYGEFHNRRKNGTTYWESATVTPIFDEQNEIKHFVAIKEDITEKKQMIADLEKATEKAIESDRLKTLFLANMSHEIRTPLNGILGFSSIICSGIKDPDKLEYYGQIIENSGRRLITVIDDIIDISMIQSNQLRIEYEKFEINDLLQEIFVTYHTQKSDKLNNIEFKVEYCENIDHNIINSDKNRIYQILKNLLDNAFKFTTAGYIEFGCAKSNDNELVLYVEDSGVGVDESKQKIIFDSFRQAEEGSSRKFDGSGLGLAIITGILDKLNGRISIKSEVGQGSVFYVTIPRKDGKVSKMESVKPEIEKKTRTISAKRIVSFEDDGSSIEYLKTVVGMLGYNLVNFVFPAEGIEYLRKNNVDMVLMDVQLPKMSGYEATKIIKAEFPDLPVIIQTAFAMAGDMEKAFNAGCDDYLPKPLSLESLKEKIVKFLGNQEE